MNRASGTFKTIPKCIPFVSSGSQKKKRKSAVQKNYLKKEWFLNQAKHKPIKMLTELQTSKPKGIHTQTHHC